MRCVSPWYNRTGWLGIKNTNLLTYNPVSSNTFNRENMLLLCELEYKDI